MKRFAQLTFLLSVIGLAWSLVGLATVSATPFNTNINFTGFTGSGFAPSPAAGQLDSDSWAISGLGASSFTFGDTTAVTGVPALGTSTGGVTTGGIYAFTVAMGNTALGVQPTGSVFNASATAHMILRLRNDSGGDVVDPSVAYTIWVLNDQPRSNAFNFSYSTDNVSYTTVASLDYTSPAAADAFGWTSVLRSTTLTGLTIPDGGLLYLRWTGGDVGGTGSRDEFALDDIVVADLTPTAVTLAQTAASQPSHGRLPFALAFLMLAVASFALGRRHN